MNDKTYSQLMWNGMRVLKRFDVQTLKSICFLNNKQVNKKYIVDYCSFLVRAGYLERIADKEEYILIKRTGSKAVVPHRTKRAIRTAYDPNTLNYISLTMKQPRYPIRELIETIMKKKHTFTVEDIAQHTKTKSSAKFYVYSFIKKGKVIKNKNIKGYQHKLAEYKYVGGKDEL